MTADIGITSGHVLLADWLFLIAAVLFLLGGLSRAASARDGRLALPGWLLEIGLCLVAVAWLVL